MKDYYKLLEVEANATQQQVRKAYYRLAKKYHPDKSSEPQHHQHFLDINEAYQILSDKSKREIYHYRWLNYKYPPKTSSSPTPKATAYTNPGNARRTTNPVYPPPWYAGHYRNYSANSFLEYETLLRQVCYISLFLSAFLFLDYLLTTVLPPAPILFFELNSSNGERYVEVFTQHASFRLQASAFLELGLRPGDNISLQRTPLLRQILKAHHQGSWHNVNLAGIYHNFFALIVLQTAMAIGGIHKGFTWPARMNFGILAGVFTLVSLAVIFMSY